MTKTDHQKRIESGYFNVQEVARMLDIHVSWLRWQIAVRRVLEPSHPFCGSVRRYYSARDVDTLRKHLKDAA